MGLGRLATLICGIAVLSASTPCRSAAADICNAVALTDVPDWGDGDPRDASGSVLKKGQIDEAVSQYRINKTTREAIFCSHGGDCYPRYVTVNGHKVEALRLTNCKIGAREPDIAGVMDEDEFYDVDVDRSRNSPSALREDDIDNALLNLGMCSACAGNAADIYIKSPQSRCGSAVARALAGDKGAIVALQSDPSYCDESSPGWAAAATDNEGTRSGADVAAERPTRTLPPPATPPAAPPASQATPINPLEITLAAVGVLYFVPSLIGFLRRKRNAPAIFALNLFLGWTFIGWVGSLVWSLLSDPLKPSAQ